MGVSEAFLKILQRFLTFFFWRGNQIVCYRCDVDGLLPFVAFVIGALRFAQLPLQVLLLLGQSLLAPGHFRLFLNQLISFFLTNWRCWCC